MSKKPSDEIEELLQWKQEQERKEAIQEATRGRIMLRCSTVIITVWTAVAGLGAWISQHYNGLEAAILAFIQAEYRR